MGFAGEIIWGAVAPHHRLSPPGNRARGAVPPPAEHGTKGTAHGSGLGRPVTLGASARPLKRTSMHHPPSWCTVRFCGCLGISSLQFEGSWSLPRRFWRVSGSEWAPWLLSVPRGMGQPQCTCRRSLRTAYFYLFARTHIGPNCSESTRVRSGCCAPASRLSCWMMGAERRLSPSLELNRLN